MPQRSYAAHFYGIFQLTVVPGVKERVFLSPFAILLCLPSPSVFKKIFPQPSPFPLVARDFSCFFLTTSFASAPLFSPLTFPLGLSALDQVQIPSLDIPFFNWSLRISRTQAYVPLFPFSLFPFFIVRKKSLLPSFFLFFATSFDSHSRRPRTHFFLLCDQEDWRTKSFDDDLSRQAKLSDLPCSISFFLVLATRLTTSHAEIRSSAAPQGSFFALRAIFLSSAVRSFHFSNAAFPLQILLLSPFPAPR